MIEELTSIIIMLIPAHHMAMRKGLLICSFSPTGRDPVAKLPMVKIKAAAKYRYMAGLLIRFWISNKIIFRNIFLKFKDG